MKKALTVSKFQKAQMIDDIDNRIWALRSIGFNKPTAKQKKEAQEVKDILTRCVYELKNLINQ
jgi:hypothetical protein